MRQKVQQKLQESLFVPRNPESLDALNIPTDLVDSAELKVYEEMRGVELSLNEFLAQKFQSIKEEMLISGSA